MKYLKTLKCNQESQVCFFATPCFIVTFLHQRELNSWSYISKLVKKINKFNANYTQMVKNFKLCCIHQLVVLNLYFYIEKRPICESNTFQNVDVGLRVPEILRSIIYLTTIHLLLKIYTLRNPVWNHNTQYIDTNSSFQQKEFVSLTVLCVWFFIPKLELLQFWSENKTHKHIKLTNIKNPSPFHPSKPVWECLTINLN